MGYNNNNGPLIISIDILILLDVINRRTAGGIKTLRQPTDIFVKLS